MSDWIEIMISVVLAAFVVALALGVADAIGGWW